MVDSAIQLLNNRDLVVKCMYSRLTETCIRRILQRRSRGIFSGRKEFGIFRKRRALRFSEVSV